MLGTSVLPHVSFLPKASAAYIACVRFLPGMYLDVIIQSFCSGECLLAVVTLVSTITSMYQPVLIENRSSQESLVAHVALEWPLSCVLLPRVICEVRLNGETLIAVLARVRFYTHVESLVGPHMARLSVTFATDIANVWPQSVVPSLVCIEGVRRGQ